jgi:hypothetical protein
MIFSSVALSLIVGCVTGNVVIARVIHHVARLALIMGFVFAYLTPEIIVFALLLFVALLFGVGL